jgi:signal transduction histidine kinase
MEENNRFEILRRLLLACSREADMKAATEGALREAAAYVGLSAASVFLWDGDDQVTFSVSHATSQRARTYLQSLEDELFSSLRRHRQLTSAYLSFEGDTSYHSFTHPLRHGSQIIGAVIGLQEGEKSLVGEDLFLEALSALLGLAYSSKDSAPAPAPSKETIEKERLGAIIETAVTVNHEINNPLTAILGNIQLILHRRENLDDDTIKKLSIVEESALKIKDVTQRLLRVTSPRSVKYTDGTNMLDLSDEEKS